nr:ribonuclease H-like domain-containing protein [Tanacetum cinerariifolium]
MTTLADKAILSRADNRPPILEKDMYDSWKSIMELYMMNRQNGRMILESAKNGPLIWPSIEENGVTRPKKYSELSATEAIQADSSVPVGSRNSSASTSVGRSIPAASGNRSASIHAGRSIHAASRNRPAFIYAGRHIPARRSNKPTPFPAGRTVPTGWINHAARPFFGPTNLCFDNVHPHVNKDIGIVDSGYSKSMTGNKDKLDHFVQVKGGTVTFGGSDGKITGKGTIRTSKLNFENVYYVEELQNFNLFSVSQICDKKNKVLFTDDECLVLFIEFQLPDESQTYKDALTQSCWIEEMQEQLNKFECLEVWELVPQPNKVMVITLKWIYKVKLHEMGGELVDSAGSEATTSAIEAMTSGAGGSTLAGGVNNSSNSC